MARRNWLTGGPAPIMPLSARLLGYGGLIPFAGTGVLVWAAWPSDMAQTALQAQLVYAAIILSFLGGIRWGVSMAKRGHFKRRAPDGFGQELALSIIPPVIGWIAFFATQALSDLRAVTAKDAPDWYAPLRLRLTFFVELALAASFARLIIA
jgi:hypothetical protein